MPNSSPVHEPRLLALSPHDCIMRQSADLIVGNVNAEGSKNGPVSQAIENCYLQASQRGTTGMTIINIFADSC